MVSHHPAQFGVHRHCGSRDLIFSVVQKQDSTCCRLHLPLLFISKDHGWKASGILSL